MLFFFFWRKWTQAQVLIRFQTDSNIVAPHFFFPYTLLLSSSDFAVAEDIGHQPQAKPRPVSGPLHVSLAGQQRKCPSRDVMSAPVTKQCRREKWRAWHDEYVILNTAHRFSNLLKLFMTELYRSCFLWSSTQSPHLPQNVCISLKVMLTMLLCGIVIIENLQ